MIERRYKLGNELLTETESKEQGFTFIRKPNIALLHKTEAAAKEATPVNETTIIAIDDMGEIGVIRSTDFKEEAFLSFLDH